MLMQFVVENFRSFRDKAVLSLIAAEGVLHAEHQVAQEDEASPRQLRFPQVAGHPPILRCAAVYGANASGKSNLVKALSFARRLVVLGTRSDDRIEVSPFKLDQPSRSAPSRFEFEIAVGGLRYSYGFVATARVIEAEWLFENDGTGERLLFERTQHHPSATPAITLGDTLAKNLERRQFFRFVAQGTRKNQLFLTEAREHNAAEIEPIARWFKRGLHVSSLTPTPSKLLRRLERNASLARFVADFLKASGTGVSNITVDRFPLDGKRGVGLAEFMVAGGTIEHDRDASGTPELVRLQMHHASATGTLIPLGLDEESAGTLQLMALAAFLYDLQRSAGGARTIVIDELERSLHPLLTRAVIKTFLESRTRGRRGQLLFTTHDTNLLDLSLLPRDSIWFTEKDGDGATSLYSLAEFKGEQLAKLGEHLEEGYLQGRFGAIPFLGDPSKLGWTRDAAE
jgi:AAA15 family ATPase/GTPase